jgi:hypothetical protein
MNSEKTPHIGMGMLVYFRSKVYEPIYGGFYDSYKGHVFKVIGVHEGDHIELECVTDDDLKVAGHVHSDELKRA